MCIYIYIYIYTGVYTYAYRCINISAYAPTHIRVCRPVTPACPRLVGVDCYTARLRLDWMCARASGQWNRVDHALYVDRKAFPRSRELVQHIASYAVEARQVLRYAGKEFMYLCIYR